MSRISLEQARFQAGDRICVRKDVTTSLPMPGYVGTVQEVIPCYADNAIGYNIYLDGDPRSRRTWFFFQQQLTALGSRERAKETVAAST